MLAASGSGVWIEYLWHRNLDSFLFGLYFALRLKRILLFRFEALDTDVLTASGAKGLMG